MFDISSISNSVNEDSENDRKPPKTPQKQQPPSSFEKLSSQRKVAENPDSNPHERRMSQYSVSVYEKSSDEGTTNTAGESLFF